MFASSALPRQPRRWSQRMQPARPKHVIQVGGGGWGLSTISEEVGLFIVDGRLLLWLSLSALK